jgi:hypothetical protein
MKARALLQFGDPTDYLDRIERSDLNRRDA